MFTATSPHLCLSPKFSLIADITAPMRQMMLLALQRSIRDKKNILSVLELRMFSATKSLTTVYQLHAIFNIIWNPYRINISTIIALSRNLASWTVPVSTTIQKSLYMASCLLFSRWLIFHNSVRESESLHSMNMLYLFILQPVIFPLQDKNILHTIKKRGRLIGSVTSCAGTVFKTTLQKEKQKKGRSDRKTRKTT